MEGVLTCIFFLNHQRILTPYFLRKHMPLPSWSAHALIYMLHLEHYQRSIHGHVGVLLLAAFYNIPSKYLLSYFFQENIFEPCSKNSHRSKGLDWPEIQCR